jgi:hypothetical protein
MEETSFFNILINSLAFPFKDPDWLKKSAIGFALVLAMYVIPIGANAVHRRLRQPHHEAHPGGRGQAVPA